MPCRPDPTALQRIAPEAWAAGRWAELAEAVLRHAARTGQTDELAALLQQDARDDEPVLQDEHLPAIGALPADAWQDVALALLAWRNGHEEGALLTALDRLRGVAACTSSAVAVAAAWRLIDEARWEPASRFAALVGEHDELTFQATGARALLAWHATGGTDEFDRLREALAAPRRAHRLEAEHAPALIATGRVFAGLGDWNRAGNDFAQAAQLIPRRETARLAATRTELALARYRHGDWHGAALEARSVDRLLAQAGAPATRSIRSAVRALQPVLAGDRRLAEQRILEARAALAERRSLVAETALLHARLLLAISADDGQALLQLVESEDEPGYRRLYSRHEWLCLHALALRLSGADERLRALVRSWASEPGALESAYYWSHACLIRMLDGAADAAEGAQRMLAGLRSDDDPLGQAWVRYVHGLVLTAAGELDTAIASLHAARTVLAGFGAAELVRNCDDAIAAARASEAAVPAPLRALTVQQRRVALLVASGRTSAQIAEDLFLSKRTVDFHVANVLRQLELTSRREIAGLLDGG